MCVYFGDLFVAIVEWLRRCDATRHTIVFTQTPCSAIDANSFVIIKCWLAGWLHGWLYCVQPSAKWMSATTTNMLLFLSMFPSVPSAERTDYCAMSIRMHFVQMKKKNRHWISFSPVTNDEVFKLMHLLDNVNVKHRSMFEVRANKSTAASEKQLVNHKSRRIKCIYAVLYFLRWIHSGGYWLVVGVLQWRVQTFSAHEFE